MLSPPDGLPEQALVSELASSWDLTTASMAYRPVGFGSHHWEVADAAGTRWFAAVDELENKRHRRSESLAVAFSRLRASLATATSLRANGCAFVVAPVPTLDGEPMTRTGDRFGVALYPFIDGQSFAWGDFSAAGHRRAVLDLVLAVHCAPAAARRHAWRDDFAIPHRDEMEAAIYSAGLADCGPYARPAARLMASHQAPLRRLLSRYDELAGRGRAQQSRAVITHGEPHPGNTMLTKDGWRLIDWDTALIAPPERDLWDLDPGDESILAAYADATGAALLPSMIELYRIRWDLADIAVDASRFRRPHSGSADDDQSFDLLRSVVERVSA
jgi:spectinomycin phosphotransferase/16S rRNA (guanine(1405)-N(7))-methyltransferase